MEENIYELDVFMAYAHGDVGAATSLAAHLRAVGLKVWAGDGPLFRGQSIRQVEELALQRARTLVLILSSNSVGEGWPTLEMRMLRFRDPLNKGRRFIPIRIDDAELPETVRENLYIDFRKSIADGDSLGTLVDLCTPPVQPKNDPVNAAARVTAKPSQTYVFGVGGRAIALAESGRHAFATAGKSKYSFALGETDGRRPVLNQASLLPWKGPRASERLICSDDATKLVAISSQEVEVFDFVTDKLLLGLTYRSRIASAGNLGDALVFGFADGTLRLASFTDVSGKRFSGHTAPVSAVNFVDPNIFVSGSEDTTIRLWNIATGRCFRVLEGHTGAVRAVAPSKEADRVITAGDDQQIRLWDLSTGMCFRVFSGHTAPVHKLAWSKDGRFFASASHDLTIRIWDDLTGRCLAVLDGLTTDALALRWTDGGELLGGDTLQVKRWALQDLLSKAPKHSADVVETSLGVSQDQVLYTNAKVLLVGESGAGKTGLSKRLAMGLWELSASTVGAWATQWKLPLQSDDLSIEREIWLWDFGGQADQRLIHQLYMDETSLVVLIFDGQRGDVFDALRQWDNDLRRASASDITKLLVAGRVDASPLKVSRSNLAAFCADHGFKAFYETSALTGQGCDELKRAIVGGIDWGRIPWRSSPKLFQTLKEEIVALKDRGKIMMRHTDLRERLEIQLHGKVERFSDDQLKAVLSLLAGPGVISELGFGGWVLFQPHLINVYAQAVIRTMLEDSSEMGCILEADVLAGRLSYHELERVPPDEEKFILHAMHQTLLQRGLCSKEFTERGPLLVFPSYYKRQRPELKGHPAILVSYSFDGFVPEIYSTLVVRLSHAKDFRREALWQDAADFRTSTDRQIGLKLRQNATGVVVEVYCDPTALLGEKIIFIRYVHEHLLVRASNVVRRRHYVCSDCSHQIVDLDAPVKRLEKGLLDMGCPVCEERVKLVDDIEKMYGSATITQEVQGLEDSVEWELDNESKERLLVGDVISTASLAGQICRELNVSDHGIDAEIEFKNDKYVATAKRIYLQLKSGDSYLRTRVDGKEIFTIKKPRHAQYWMDHESPVLLVIRTSDGVIRWMEIREYLKEEYKGRKKQARSFGRNPDSEETLPKQIEFVGEAFNTHSIYKWRERVVGIKPAPRRSGMPTQRA